MTVTIGIDPHKGSHAAVAVDERERTVGQLEVETSRRQAGELLGWAEQFGSRRWAIESAGGLGYLLGQQLVMAGEQVVEVPATLAARVRVLGSGKSVKNDPNDARSVAIAALRQPGLRQVHTEDHVQVLRMLAKRYKDLSSLRTQAVCRLHAVVTVMVPGGISKELVASQAAQLLARIRPDTAVERERKRIARELLDDVRRLDRERKASRRRLEAAVAAADTTLTDIFGVGPVVAALVIGYTNDVARFPTRHHYAAYNGTAPIEASSGKRIRHRLNPGGNRKLNHAIHLIAMTQLRYPTKGRAYYERKLAEGNTTKEAMRALKRRISDAVYRQLRIDRQDTQQ